MYKILIIAMMACLVECGVQLIEAQSVPSSSVTQFETASESQYEESNQTECTPSPDAGSTEGALVRR